MTNSIPSFFARAVSVFRASLLYVLAITAILCFMPPILPDLLLAVAGVILSFAWFTLLKARLS
jgi:uncharacterized membrane protein YccC